MAELEDKSLNSQNTDSNPETGKIINRLLKRKSGSGVILPKIRSRIAKITHNADRIRDNRLDLPGNTRRKRIKTFNEKLIRKESGNFKLKSIQDSKKKSGSWDNIDMLLPNGSSMEKAGSAYEQPNIGLPTGGQVIAPFNPPPVSDHEPSFIERRRARLKAQEEKQSKPQTKKAEPTTRLYSRVEEIHPQSNRKIDPRKETPSESRSPAKNIEKTESPKGKSEEVHPPKSEKEVFGPSEVKSSDPSPIKPSDKKNVVQRQPETDHTLSRKVEEGKPQQEKQPPVQSDTLKSAIDEDLHTLAAPKLDVKPKKSEEKTSLPEKKQAERKISSPEEVIKKESKKIPRSESKIPEIKPVNKEKTIDRVNEDFEKRKDFISETKENDDQLLDGKIKGLLPTLKTPNASIQREKDENLGKQQEISKDQKPSDKTDENKKLDLPLATKSQPKKELDNKDRNEMDESPKEKNISPKLAKQERITEKIPPTEQSSKSKVGDKKTKELETSDKRDVQKQQDEKLFSHLEKPLITPRIKRISLIKPFIAKQQGKTEKISQILNKPIFKPTSGTARLLLSKPNQIQRQYEADKRDLSVEQKPELALKKVFSTSDVKTTIESTSPIQDGTSPIGKQPIEKEEREQPKKKLEISPTSKGFSKVVSEKKIGVNQTRTPKFLKKVNALRKTSPTLQSKKMKLPFLVKTSESSFTKGDQPQKVLRDSTNRMQSDSREEQSHLPKVSTMMGKVGAGEKILLTSPGRKSIQSQVKKTKQSLDKSKISESKLPSVVPFSTPEADDHTSTISQIMDKRYSSERMTGTVPEKKSTRMHPSSMDVVTQKKSKVLDEKKLNSDVELPVVQMKKVETKVPIFQPEQPVPGPVVQRMIYPAEDNVGITQDVSQQSEKPDLERLAKDIYPIIKRWIAIEKERTSGRLY
ncbi:MAG TPA: hypothetical protein VK856_00265 [Anaerolineaceae bacterium]|nr:hypothetical protein [Anaerolineaceae bacterium]